MAVPVQKRHALVAVTTPWRDTSARDCPAEAQPLLMLMLRRRSMPGAWMLPRPLPQLRRAQHAVEGDRQLPATTERAILSVAARSSHKTRRWAPLRTSCCCGTCRRWPCRRRRGRSSQVTCWRWRSQRRAFRDCCRPTWRWVRPSAARPRSTESSGRWTSSPGWTWRLQRWSPCSAAGATSSTLAVALRRCANGMSNARSALVSVVGVEWGLSVATADLCAQRTTGSFGATKSRLRLSLQGRRETIAAQGSCR